jgi:hypothetical protein
MSCVKYLHFQKKIIFKVVKYTKTQCLEIHLKVYYSKMVKIIHDEKLLILLF